MEVAGPLGTPLGLAQRKRASPRGKVYLVKAKGSCQEELPHVRGQGQRPRVPDCDGAGMAERSYAPSEVRGGGQEELPHAPKPEARGDCREELPHAPTPEIMYKL